MCKCTKLFIINQFSNYPTRTIGNEIYPLKEKLKDRKLIIRSGKSEDRQYNEQTKKDKMNCSVNRR